MDGRGSGRAATLQNPRGQPLAVPFEDEPQGRRRGFGCRCRRAEQRGKAWVGLRRDCQPLQLGIARLRQPSEQRMAGAGAQYLLGRPQCIASTRRPHHDQIFEVHTRFLECGGIRQVRRREPGNAPTLGRERGKRRQHQLQLAHPLLRAQDLGKRASRPAAAGQLGI